MYLTNINIITLLLLLLLSLLLLLLLLLLIFVYFSRAWMKITLCNSRLPCLNSVVVVKANACLFHFDVHTI